MTATGTGCSSSGLLAGRSWTMKPLSSSGSVWARATRGGESSWETPTSEGLLGRALPAGVRLGAGPLLVELAAVAAGRFGAGVGVV